MLLSPYISGNPAGWTLAAATLFSLPLVWRRGHGDERACALALVFGIVTDLAIQLIDSASPSSLAHAAGNLLVLTLVTRNALISRRTFPQVMAAAQLIAVTVYPWFWLGLIDGQLGLRMILIAMDGVTIAALWAGSAQSRREQASHA